MSYTTKPIDILENVFLFNFKPLIYENIYFQYFFKENVHF